MISYQQEKNLSVSDFREILISSGLAERRPVHDRDRLQKMIDHADVILTARSQERIIGIARAITDFSYCCYLSDLAVDKNFQKMGVGKKLMEMMSEISGAQTSLILLAAPSAEAYYSKIGMTPINNGWIWPRKH